MGPRFAGTEVVIGGQSFPPRGQEIHVSQWLTLTPKEEPEYEKIEAVLPPFSDRTHRNCSELGSENHSMGSSGTYEPGLGAMASSGASHHTRGPAGSKGSKTEHHSAPSRRLWSSSTATITAEVAFSFSVLEIWASQLT